jgi:hypothetical protein
LTPDDPALCRVRVKRNLIGQPSGQKTRLDEDRQARPAAGKRLLSLAAAIWPTRLLRATIQPPPATGPWRGCCIKPSRKSCFAIAEMPTRAATCDDVRTDLRWVTDAMADFGAHP